MLQAHRIAQTFWIHHPGLPNPESPGLSKVRNQRVLALPPPPRRNGPASRPDLDARLVRIVSSQKTAECGVPQARPPSPASDRPRLAESAPNDQRHGQCSACGRRIGVTGVAMPADSCSYGRSAPPNGSQSLGSRRLGRQSPRLPRAMP